MNVLHSYQGFCKKYKPKAKAEKSCSWGNQLLPKVIKEKGKKASPPGQMRLPWGTSEATNPEIVAVAEKFIFANCYNSQVAGIIFQARSL
jgi:putative transposase